MSKESQKLKLLAQRAEHEAKCAQETKAIKAIQEQLDAIQIDEFWEVNPGIRLAKGDKLIVTPERFAADYAINGRLADEVGAICEVYDISINEYGNVSFMVTGAHGVAGASFAHVRAMREAWLALERIVGG